MASKDTSTIKLSRSCEICDSSKSLSNLTKSVLIQQCSRDVPLLKRELKRHRSMYLSLIGNDQTKNAKDAELLKSSAVKETKIVFDNEDRASTKKLEPELVEEALILSDLFNLNELRATELLFLAETQSPRYPLWPRGLIAVLLYYDSKLSLLHSLKLITRALPGNTWSSDLDNSDIVEFLDAYVIDLINDGLVGRILEALKSFDLTSEFEKLRRQKALGDSRHRRMLSESMDDIAVTMSEIISNISCQKQFSATDATKVIEFLKNRCSNEKRAGVFDNDNVKVVYVNVVSALSYSFASQTDESFIQTIHHSLTLNPPFVQNNPTVNDNKEFQCLFSFLFFDWSVTLRKLSNETTLSESCKDFQDEDEWFCDQAIVSNVFLNLLKIVNSKNFYSDEFRVRKMHQLVSDFIFYFPLKVRDLRNHGDEVARTVAAYIDEGISPPNDFNYDYEYFLRFMTSFYKNQNYNLTDDFWKIDEANFINSPTKNVVSNTQRYLSLHKFCLSAADYVASLLYGPLVDLLSALSCTYSSAWACLQFLISAFHNPAHSTLSLHHFFNALQLYYNNLREERLSSEKAALLSSSQKTTNANLNMSKQHAQSHHRAISPLEIHGIESMLNLISTICSHNKNAAQVLAENADWKVIYTLFGLVTCKVPVSIKSKCMSVLSAIASYTKYAPTIWSCMEKYQLIDLSQNPLQLSKSGMILELEEFETKLGCYDLSISFCRLINNIIRYTPKKFNLQILITFLIDKLLNHFNTRFYADSKCMYEVPLAVFEVVDTVITNFETDDAHLDVVEAPIVTQLIGQLYKDSNLTKKIFLIVEKTVQKLENFQFGEERDTEAKLLVDCCIKCLEMICKALEVQDSFVNHNSKSSLHGNDIYIPMDNLLQCLNNKNSFHDHLHTILKLVIASYGSSVDSHLKLCNLATKVMALHSKLSLNQTRSFKYLLAEPATASLLTQTFVSIIEDHQCNPEAAQNVLQYFSSLFDFPKGTIAHYVFGLEDERILPGRQKMLFSSLNGLHAVTYVLDLFIANLDHLLSHEEANVVCICYKILYKMSLLPDSYLNTLRLMQNIDWFLCRHLVAMIPIVENQQEDRTVIILHNAYSWLIKTFAVDLKALCSQKQQSSVAKLCSCLFETTSASAFVANRVLNDTLFAPSALSFSTGMSTMLNDVTSMIDSSSGNKKPWILESISDFFSFEAKPEHELQVEWLNTDLLVRAFTLAEKEQHDCKGFTYFDVKKLHKVLLSEITSEVSNSEDEREAFLNDIQVALAFAGEDNIRKDDCVARKMFLSSWCELVEVCILYGPREILTEIEKQQTILSILEFLCKTLNLDNLVPEFAVLITRAILSIFNFLRQSSMNASVADDVSHLGTVLLSSTSDVLKNLLQFYIYGDLCRKDTLCVNILSSILTYLRLFSPKSNDSEESERLVFGNNHNWSIIMSFGELFFRKLFSDSSLGHIVQKTIALSVFCDLVDLDSNYNIVTLMSKEGFLQKMILEFSTDNASLIANLQNADPYDALYMINNAKLCLLSKVAQSAKGAASLLHCGLINALNRMTFIDCRPVTSTANLGLQKTRELTANQIAAHRQVFMPMLECCHNILTTLPTSYHDASNSILEFIVAHFEVFLDILNCDTSSKVCPTVDAKQDLREIKVACGVISAAAMQGSVLLEGGPQSMFSVLHLQETMRKLHLQLLKTLSVFGNLDNWDRFINCASVLSEKELIRSTLVSILCHLMSYVNGHTMSVLCEPTAKDVSQVIFFPSAVAPNVRSIESSKGANDYCNMGVLFRMIAQLVDEMLVLVEEKTDFEKLLAKDRYSEEEYNKFGTKQDSEFQDIINSKLPHGYQLSSQNDLITLKHNLAKFLILKDEQMHSMYYLLELIMFVLFRHLSYYFTKFDSDIFTKAGNSASNFKKLRHMLASNSHYTRLLNDKRDEQRGNASGQNAAFGQSISDEKLSQIKDFQFDTLQSLPPSLLNRVLTLDSVLNDVLSAKHDSELEFDKGDSTNGIDNSFTFLSLHVKQVDKLLRCFADKVNASNMIK